MLPPVRRTVEVPLKQAPAFELFVRRIGEWWPLATRSISGPDAATCAVEERVGGRIFETARDGSEQAWGEILVWEAPARLVFTWRIPGMTAATEVEVRFVSVEAGTRVELEHRHWERLGADAALLRGLYDGGWPKILDRFEALAAGRALPPPPSAPGCIDVLKG